MTDDQRQRFRLDLEQDAIFSLTAASAGGHRSLDHIPGAVLRGVVGQHYVSFGDDAWEVFHSGAVCFGNAYPLSPDGHPTLPVPLSWRADKTGTPSVDLAKAEANAETREDIRGAFVDRTGLLVKTQLRYRQKTALDRTGHGRPRQGALFGYASLARGQSFWFDLTFSRDVSADLRQRIIRSLTEAPVRLGRSRGAEYGRARVALLPAPPPPWPLNETIGKHVSVYLAADLAPPFLEGAGPDAALFGLPKQWSLVAERSFLRTRAYAPFNGAWSLFDQDRQVWEKGGVVTFAVDDGDRPRLSELLTTARRASAAGVGLFRAEGLGQVLIEPWLLGAARITKPPPPSSPPSAAEPASQPILRRWASIRARDRLLPLIAQHLIDEVEAELYDLYRRAGEEASAAGKGLFDIAPSKAQWGALAEEVERLTGRQYIQDALLREPDRRDRTRIDKGGFCYAGVGAGKWCFQAPGQSRGFLTLLARFTDKDRLAKALTDDGLSADEASVDALCTLALLLLARRAPRLLAHHRGATARGQ